MSTCIQPDWYELGRRDGLKGQPIEKLEIYRRECPSKSAVEPEALYTNGRNAGLVEFCTLENAFEMGRQGLNYSPVCSSLIEPRFLESMERGKAARLLEEKSQWLNTEIETLSDKIERSENPNERKNFQGELELLKQRLAETAREMASLTKSF